MTVMAMKKIAALVAAGVTVLALSSCHGDTPEPEHDSSLQHETVSVSKGNITPTAAEKAIVAQAAQVVVVSGTRADFEAYVKIGEQVVAGQVIGRNGESEVVSPIAAKVVSITTNAPDLPENYPLFALQYQGFGIVVQTGNLLRSAAIEQLTGKFQITDGVGPTACVAVLSAAASADTVEEQQTQQTVTADEAAALEKPFSMPAPSFGLPTPQVAADRVVCLIDKGIAVQAGQQATVVISGNTAAETLLLPLNAVAGRQQRGQVMRVQGDKYEVVDVELGISDGAKIQILSGLQEGDSVINFSPHLDPRGQ